MNNLDQDRLDLLDPIAERVPELDLRQHSVEWTEMPDDGSHALMINGDGSTATTASRSPEELLRTSRSLRSAPGCMLRVKVGAQRADEPPTNHSSIRAFHWAPAPFWCPNRR